ncbi:hypothetical protein ACTFIR_010877 [Dictyostelium discoideum]
MKYIIFIILCCTILAKSDVFNFEPFLSGECGGVPSGIGYSVQAYQCLNNIGSFFNVGQYDYQSWFFGIATTPNGGFTIYANSYEQENCTGEIGVTIDFGNEHSCTTSAIFVSINATFDKVYNFSSLYSYVTISQYPYYTDNSVVYEVFSTDSPGSSSSSSSSSSSGSSSSGSSSSGSSSSGSSSSGSSSSGSSSGSSSSGSSSGSSSSGSSSGSSSSGSSSDSSSSGSSSGLSSGLSSFGSPSGPSSSSSSSSKCKNYENFLYATFVTDGLEIDYKSPSGLKETYNCEKGIPIINYCAPNKKCYNKHIETTCNSKVSPSTYTNIFCSK